MKKAYIAILALLFAVSLFGFKQVSADAVTINGVLNASFGGANPDVPTNISGTLGNRLSFDTNLGATPGFSFGYWVINDFVRPELAVNYEFMISSKFELDALFAPEGSHVVVFADSNGKVLNTQRVVNGGSASDAAVTVPSRPGLTVATPKWKTLNNETSLTNITSNKVFFLQYSVSSETTYTLSVVGGTGAGTKNYNEVVTVSANADSEGNIFSHWEENGFVVSTQRDFSFTMLSNRSLTAVFVASGPEANAPRVTLSDDLVIRSGFQSYVGQYYLPIGYELVEFGLISSTNSAVITHASSNLTVHIGSKAIAQTNEFLMSLAIGSHQSVRAYLIVKNGETVSTIYSDNNIKFLETAEYETGFENAVKGSYATGSVSIDGVSWILNDALIDGLANDRKEGLKSVRIQASGFIQSNVTFNNISEISFKVAKYGTDGNATVKVEISKNGTNWIDVTDAASSNPFQVTSTTLQEVSILLSNSATYRASGYLLTDEVYIKISKSDGNRVNLDALSIKTIFDGAIHTVTFNNEGSTSTSAVMNGSTVTQPTNPTKTGYTFNGWYQAVDFSGSAYVFSTAVTSSFTLYAKFTINQYTITFNSNSGSAVTAITQDYSTSVTQPSDPTRAGHTFAGWYSDAGLTSAYSFETMPAQNITLFAKWTVNQYTISFNSNGGSSVTAITQNYGSNVSAPSNPEKENYLFAGWYSDSELTQEYSFSTMPAENITLYAKWNEVSGPVELTAPTSLSINSSTEILSWSAVAGAESYLVYVGTETYSVSTTSINLGSQTLTGNTNYQVKVKAIGNGTTTLDSPLSSLVTYSRIRFTDLIISEYIEGSSNNKYIEIYNGTGASVDLSNYQLLLFSNGATSASTTQALSGTLAHNTTIIFKNSSAALTLPFGVTASNGTAIGYNGDDALALKKVSTGAYVDVFGVIGQDPGTAWTSTTPSNSTLDKTLVRNPNVYAGITVSPSNSISNNFVTLGTEWTQHAIDTASNLGSHTVTFSTTVNIPA